MIMPACKHWVGCLRDIFSNACKHCIRNKTIK
jgi:hypothetical protein